jgi:N-acetylneuraminic acid mutarotase
MPSKRGGLTSAAVNGTIYVFGGEEPGGTFNNNEKYDPKTNTWTSDIPMPTARHGLAAVAVDDKIYVIGGGPEPGGSQTNLNEIFQSATTMQLPSQQQMQLSQQPLAAPTQVPHRPIQSMALGFLCIYNLSLLHY